MDNIWSTIQVTFFEVWTFNYKVVTRLHRTEIVLENKDDLKKN